MTDWLRDIFNSFETILFGHQFLYNKEASKMCKEKGSKNVSKYVKPYRNCIKLYNTV